MHTHTRIKLKTSTDAYILTHTFMFICMSNVDDCTRGRPEGFLFNSYYTEVSGRALFLSVDWSHFTLDTYLIILSVKQAGIKYHLLSFWNDST